MLDFPAGIRADPFEHRPALAYDNSLVGILFTDNAGLHIDNPVGMLLHLLYGHRNSVGNLIAQKAEGLLADQLCRDLAHRLVRDGLLIIKLRPLRQILKK